MNIVKQFFTRHLLALPISVTTWLYAMIGLNIGFFGATGLMIVAYGSTLFISKQVQTTKNAKALGLSRGEYRRIMGAIDDAKSKLRELNNNYSNVRSVHSFRQLYDLNQIAKKVIQLVQQNPTKFYLVDRFFYAHLDSAVEVTSKYTLLTNQPIQDKEFKIALATTKHRLNDIKELLEEDLKKAVSTDVSQMNIELDYIDVALKNSRPKAIEEEIKHD